METDKKILDANVVNFFSRKKEYRSLSNFWEKDVSIFHEEETRIYESGEHCFHGEKYIRLGNLCRDENRKIILISHGKKIIKPSQFTSCAIAKKAGGKNGLLLNNEETENWEPISIEVQKEICQWKFENYEEVKSDLLKSGTKFLVHPALRCKSGVWNGKGVIRDGVVEIIGKNMIGNIWMEVRNYIL